jgi:Tfp pilus assembly protein PilE
MQGNTLIEMMIIVAIIGILIDYLLHSKAVEAISLMAALKIPAELHTGAT